MENTTSPHIVQFHRLLEYRYLRVAAAFVYAASTILFTILWVGDAHWKPALPQVELGFDTDFLPEDQAQYVSNVHPSSPAERAGLRAGDKILLIDNKKVKDAAYLSNVWRTHRPGDTISLSIHRSGVPGELSIRGVFRLRELTVNEGGLDYFAGEIRNSFPIPFVIVGLTVLFLRLEDPAAWLLAILSGSFAATPGFSNQLTIAPGFLPFTQGYSIILLSLLGPVFYFFFSTFPVQSPIDRRVPWLKWVSVVVGISFTISGWKNGKLLLPPPLHAMVGQLASSEIVFLFTIVFLILGLLSLSLNFAYAKDSEVRRKIRVIVWGSAIGVAPSVVYAMAQNFLSFYEPVWLMTVRVGLLWLFPISFAYAVVKHRVLEIPVLIKRSARYLLVQRGFTFLISIVSIGLVLAFALSLSGYFRPSIQLAQPFAIALGAGFGTVLLWGGVQVHRRISGKIDKAFFRSAYDARLILESLAEKSAGATDRRQLADLLEHYLSEALQPQSLAIYLRTGDETLKIASGIVPPGSETLSTHSPLLHDLSEKGEPIEFPLKEALTTPGISSFASMNPEYLVPMAGRNKQLAGFIVIGSRLSEEPYSNEDKRLLSTVATQAGTALENIRLAEEITERIETEQLLARETEIERRLLEADNKRKTKELDEARALQLAMLPTSVPAVPNLDIAVYMKTATEVGGDYYDFALASDGTLTVALGDATGHGAKAGTMVVAAKSLFTSFSDLPSLIDIFQRFTCSIKKLNMKSMFMAMLLLRIKNNSVVASSAGMPYPIVYRAATGTVEEIVLKGMPLGAFSDFPYEEKKFCISEGDAVVLMSDGFPEMFNEKRETFGYSRVRDIVFQAGSKTSKEIVEHLSKVGEEWSNGESQNDDVTFVVLKMKKGERG
jgi:serine phosphatase RsbU (regulator of sigma subunit)